MTADLRFSDSVVVARSPEQVYALVSDVTRTGEWSPTCTACWWDEGAGPRAGQLVHRPQRDAAAHLGDPLAGGGRRPRPGVHLGGGRRARPLELPARALRRRARGSPSAGTFLPAGLAFFAEKYGADAPAQVEERRRSAYDGIPRTLAAIKAVAESSADGRRAGAG